MADASEDAKDIEKLYEYGERLNEAKDKSQVCNSQFCWDFALGFWGFGFWLIEVLLGFVEC